MDSLEAYSRAFNHVEVNTTFYQVPPSDMVRSWRDRVPKDFQFVVRCHRSITHAHHFDPNSHVLNRMAEMAEIVRSLGADALHFLTPPTFQFERQHVEDFTTLLDSTSLQGIDLVLEARSYSGRSIPRLLKNLLEDRGIVHCVDLTKEEPQVESPLLYTRLFGKGYHTVYQFSDEDLDEIYKRGTSRDYRKAIFTFHGVRMYSDAGRFLSYVKKKGLPVTQARGQKRLF
ncbi:MAG: DUF72 domain-containing protein [Thermoplasmata archaeon]